jgi:hypothetical protein
MPPRLNVSKNARTAAKRMVRYGACVGLAILAIAWFGLHQKMHAAEHTVPNPPVSAAPKKVQSHLVATYGKLPLSFEANQGQTDPSVKFLSRGRGFALFLTWDEAVLTLERASQKSKGKSKGPGLQIAR